MNHTDQFEVISLERFIGLHGLFVEHASGVDKVLSKKISSCHVQKFRNIVDPVYINQRKGTRKLFTVASCQFTNIMLLAAVF